VQAIGDLENAERPADEGDAAAALIDQVGDRQVAAGDVVHRDRGEGPPVGRAVDQDDRSAVPIEPVRPGPDVAERGHQQALDALLLEEVQVAGLSLRGLVTVREQHRQAVLYSTRHASIDMPKSPPVAEDSPGV
jgi:hypothetical protein